MPLDAEQYDDIPVVLRGSKSYMKFSHKHINLADRFCRKAAGLLRITTKYSWQFLRGEVRESPEINRIIKSANERFPRQRSGCDYLGFGSHYRFEKGKVLFLGNEPEAQAQYDLAETMAKTSNFFEKVQQARELLNIAARMERQ